MWIVQRNGFRRNSSPKRKRSCYCKLEKEENFECWSLWWCCRYDAPVLHR